MSRDSHRRSSAQSRRLEEEEQQRLQEHALLIKISAEEASFRDLFFFADSTDIHMLAVATVCAIGAGVLLPLWALLFADSINAFFPYDRDELLYYVYLFFILGGVLLLLELANISLFTISAARQTRKMRQMALESAMRQEIAWFDVNKGSEVSSKISANSLTVQEGVGKKFGGLIKFTAQFMGGFAVAFVQSWKLAGVMSACLPAIAIATLLMVYYTSKAARLGQEAYSRAGGVADEALSNIRTIVAFESEKLQADKYESFARVAEKVQIKAAVKTTVLQAGVMTTLWLTLALGVWYGGKLIVDRDSSIDGVGDIFGVFFSVLLGGMAAGQAGPNITALVNAKASAAFLIFLVKRQPEIDLLKDSSTKAEKDETISGNIKFSNIHFAYPSRPDAPVLRGLSVSVEAGSTVAFVGASGSGKSTIVSLVERFYDPDQGSIMIDGRDIREYNLSWLREQIALVGQEPVLFATTIRENIRSGRPSATDKEVEEAAKMANAHDFIMEFPDAYDTQAGDKGAQLSGGQKQRIAIARAVIRDASILLLDEATSALDTDSERVVQDALDALLVHKRRTTLVVAHRLSTIRNADKIVVLLNGQIEEQGTHDELMQHRQIYAKLVQLQGGVEEESEDVLSKEEEEAVMEIQRLSGSSSSDVAVQDLVQRFSRKSSSRSLRSASNVLDGGMQENLLDESERYSLAEKETDKKKEQKKMEKKALNRMWKLNTEDRHILAVALIGSVLQGCVYPALSIIIVEMADVFTNIFRPAQEILDEVNQYALAIVVVAVFSWATQFAQNFAFKVMGEKLTTKLRMLSFRSMLRQEIGWHDLPENSAGTLTQHLAEDTPKVRAVAGENQGRVVQNLITLVLCIGAAFIFGSWQLTLINIGILPFFAFAGFIEEQLAMAGNDDFNFCGTGDEAAEGHGGSIGDALSEGLVHIRTVQAFNLQEVVADRHDSRCISMVPRAKKRGAVSGVAVGFAWFIYFAGYGVVFYCAGWLVNEKLSTFNETFTSMMTIMLAAAGIGESVAYMGDAAAARGTLAKMFALEDRKPPIPYDSDTGLKPESVVGDITVEHVHFRYPARPSVPVLTDYSLQIKAGTTVALVGGSGGGKSTVVNLVERFYDPHLGSVALDGTDVRDLNPKWLRRKIGLVGQEPVLFDASIEENIRLGRPDATEEEIIRAAKLANAHEFISGFPEKYRTSCGDKGGLLSGGQKQRIALARAIIRDPAILLLDEATSALDTASERVVQSALDDLLRSKNRTTIVIAHRLSTIRNADKIVVIMNGSVVEQGTHDELANRADSVYSGLLRKHKNEDQT